jgi:hypothetical protein
MNIHGINVIIDECLPVDTCKTVCDISTRKEICIPSRVDMVHIKESNVMVVSPEVYKKLETELKK